MVAHPHSFEGDNVNDVFTNTAYYNSGPRPFKLFHKFTTVKLRYKSSQVRNRNLATQNMMKDLFLFRIIRGSFRGFLETPFGRAGLYIPEDYSQSYSASYYTYFDTNFSYPEVAIE